MIIGKKKCTEHTTGVVFKLKDMGDENATTLIMVKYLVDGVEYEIKETLTVKNEWIKIGFLPVGQRQTPVMGLVKEGDEVDVSYNPDKPKKAFITDNTGKLC